MKIASKPWFVPDTTTLQDQLNAFLRRKAHFAIVVDEYGEVEGLVTLEDIIEEIVGEIADEHDVDIQGVKQEADGSVVVDGTVPIRDLNRALDWSLPDDEATTIAGLVIHETQSIPEEKQAFTFHGKRFIVMKRDKNRITRIRIRPPSPCTSREGLECRFRWRRSIGGSQQGAAAAKAPAAVRVAIVRPWSSWYSRCLSTGGYCRWPCCVELSCESGAAGFSRSLVDLVFFPSLVLAAVFCGLAGAFGRPPSRARSGREPPPSSGRSAPPATCAAAASG